MDILQKIMTSIGSMEVIILGIILLNPVTNNCPEMTLPVY